MHSSKLQELLAEYPGIQQVVDERLRTQRLNGAVSIAVLQYSLFDACRSSGPRPDEYPMDTLTGARRAPERYTRARRGRP